MYCNVMTIFRIYHIQTTQIYLMMGLASMIDTAFATEKREKLKNIDAALRVYEYTSFYLRDYEGAMLQVNSARNFQFILSVP